MNYKVNIWQGDNFKREIVYSANNDIQAIQMASQLQHQMDVDLHLKKQTNRRKQCPTVKEPMVQNEEDQAVA